MNTTANLILALALIVIMMGMGLSLELRHFKKVLIRPGAVILGLFNQLILLPAIGFFIAFSLDLSTDIAIGLMILAACPGGATSNLIAHLAKADVALSVTLTALSSMITIFSIPLIVNLALSTFGAEASVVQLDVLETIGKIFVIVIGPVALGMIIRRRAPLFADKMERPVRRASTIFLVLIILGIILQERHQFVDYLRMAGSVSILLNFSTVGIGFFTAYLFRLRSSQGLSIAIESGVQNGTMAMMIATLMLGETAYAIVPAVYSLVMFASGFLIVVYGMSKHHVHSTLYNSY